MYSVLRHSWTSNACHMSIGHVKQRIYCDTLPIPLRHYLFNTWWASRTIRWSNSLVAYSQKLALYGGVNNINTSTMTVCRDSPSFGEYWVDEVGTNQQYHVMMIVDSDNMTSSSRVLGIIAACIYVSLGCCNVVHLSAPRNQYLTDTQTICQYLFSLLYSIN